MTVITGLSPIWDLWSSIFHDPDAEANIGVHDGAVARIEGWILGLSGTG